MKHEGQDKVYDFIVAYVKENLFAPSIRDICQGCGYTSTSTVATHLYQLQKRGLIELPNEWGSPRCIKLVGYKLERVEDGNRS